MKRIAGYLTNKIGKTDRKQTQKDLIEYYFMGKFKQALSFTVFVFPGIIVSFAVPLSFVFIVEQNWFAKNS